MAPERAEAKAESTVFGRVLALAGLVVILLCVALVAIPLLKGNDVPVVLLGIVLIGGLAGLLVFGVGAHMVARDAGGFLARLAEIIVAGIKTWRGKNGGAL